MTRPIGPPLTRREALSRIGGGFGALGLAGAFADAGLLAGPARGLRRGRPGEPARRRSRRTSRRGPSA